MVAAAGELLRQKGFESTKVREVATVADAPMGSFYFHFPGGKEELAAEAMRSGGAEFTEFLVRCLGQSGLLENRVARIATALADTLEASRWRHGCPVATTALETLGRSALLQEASNEAIDDWVSCLAGRFLAAGIGERASENLAVNVISIIEGAELLSRIRLDGAPLRQAARALKILTKEAQS